MFSMSICLAFVQQEGLHLMKDAEMFKRKIYTIWRISKTCRHLIPTVITTYVSRHSYLFLHNVGANKCFLDTKDEKSRSLYEGH